MTPRSSQKKPQPPRKGGVLPRQTAIIAIILVVVAAGVLTYFFTRPKATSSGPTSMSEEHYGNNAPDMLAKWLKEKEAAKAEHREPNQTLKQMGEILEKTNGRPVRFDDDGKAYYFDTSKPRGLGERIPSLDKKK
jgi:hypothetical protein